MASKRRSSSRTQAGEKKIKKDPDVPLKDKFTIAKEALKTAAPQAKTTRNRQTCFANYEVHEDYDCILHQTNIATNDNNYFLIQILTHDLDYYCFTRWGRVGEINSYSDLAGPWEVDAAVKCFKKIFKKETKNNWSDRDNFVSHSGKYTMIELNQEQDGEVEVNTRINTNVLPCTLDKPTKKLIEMIFNKDMIKKAMSIMNLDNMMPLGKLSKQQIAKGFEVLEEIEAALEKNKEVENLEELNNKFFTIIPHDFGLNRPTIISDDLLLQIKKEMLLVLADIEIVQTLVADSVKGKEETVPHPLDQNYQSLKCNLNLLDKKAEEYKIIKKYFKATGNACVTLVNVWKVDKMNEAERFSENDALENRKLLWHGTNVAVVAAILKSGLRIMPQSGGRVGRGIYFASENSKSLSHVRMSSNTGLMFLSEVALGKEHTVTKDDCTLRKPPPGYDSVVARGRSEPDPSKDIFLEIDGKQVVVPQGIAIPQLQYTKSSFHNSEYLIYKESQCRIRYLVELRNSWKLCF